MKRFAGFAMFLTVLFSAQSGATTYHRLPLAYIPYSINAWYDNSPNSDGVTRRYDGLSISSSSSYFYDGHKGTDFGAPYGTVVYTSASGVIYDKYTLCSPNGGFRGNTCGLGFGNYVAIKHADNMVSIYAHLSSVSVGAIGTTISCTNGPGGTTVGYSGNSGDSTGAHLHYGLRYNNLSASSPNYDPFYGSWSTQQFEYWAYYALVSDPLRPGYNMHYPAATCQ